MNGTYIKIMTLLTVLALLAGCGGGGSTITGGVTNGPTNSIGTTVSGVAAKGILFPGKVFIYKLRSDGSKDVSFSGLLASRDTDADGSYIADLGTYTGPILVEASGTYTDEATGATKTILESTPLRAALANATGKANVSVTPLTELAVQKAGTLTPSAITAANALVTDLFKVDVIGTRPVKFELTTLNNTGSQAAKDYTLALAAFSQQTDGTTVGKVLDEYTADIAQGTMSAACAAEFTTALATIMSKTSITADTTKNLWSMGTKKYPVKLRVLGSAEPIYGINIVLDLPAGLSVRANQDGSVVDGVVVPSGTATGVSFFKASFTPAAGSAPAQINFAMADTKGFTAGEIVTLNCDMAAGVTDPNLSTYHLSVFKPVNKDGFVIAGLTAILSE